MSTSRLLCEPTLGRRPVLVTGRRLLLHGRLLLRPGMASMIAQASPSARLLRILLSITLASRSLATEAPGFPLDYTLRCGREHHFIFHFWHFPEEEGVTAVCRGERRWLWEPTNPSILTCSLARSADLTPLVERKVRPVVNLQRGREENPLQFEGKWMNWRGHFYARDCQQRGLYCRHFSWVVMTKAHFISPSPPGTNLRALQNSK